MCSRVLLPPGRFGPLRAEVGVGFRRVRFGSGASVFPLLRWSCSVVRRPPLFFPLPFQGLPVPGQVCCIGVLSFPLLLRSPFRVLVK